MDENENVEVLKTIDGTYIDENMMLDSQNIPEFTEEETSFRSKLHD